jgi:hypothetical protein
MNIFDIFTSHFHTKVEEEDDRQKKFEKKEKQTYLQKTRFPFGDTVNRLL